MMPPDNQKYIPSTKKATGDKIAGATSCGDFVIRKSEPIWVREVGAEQLGLLEVAAGGLHFVKQPEIFPLLLWLLRS
jgi:hypothetical protein